MDIKSMFESIKESLAQQKKGGSGNFRDILRTEMGNTYIGRFVPDVNNPKDTFFHYWHHGWNSVATGQYVDVLCPTTFNERCPICEARIKLYRTKKPEDEALAKLIRRIEAHLANWYVENNPTAPDTEGKLMILRMGKRVYEKVEAAIDGDDAKDFGPRIFDLTENGCDFRLKVEAVAEGTRKYANYGNSRFSFPSAIPGMTPEKMKEVLGSVHNLREHVEMKSADEIKKMLDVHLFGKIDAETAKQIEDSKKKDDLPFERAPEPAAAPVSGPTPQAAPTPAPAVEVKKEEPKPADNALLKDLLAELDTIGKK